MQTKATTKQKYKKYYSNNNKSTMPKWKTNRERAKKGK